MGYQLWGIGLGLILTLAAASCGDGTPKTYEVDRCRRHSPKAQCLQPSDFVLKTKTGEHALTLEVVKTSTQQQFGLMFRNKMPENHGMIFVYNEPAPRTMWMKNTYIPLDMLFLRGGQVAEIARNAQPKSLKLIQSRELVDGVLELNAGTVKRLGIRVGDRLVHQRHNGL